MIKIMLFDEEILLSSEIREGFKLRNPDVNFSTVQTYREALNLVKEVSFDIVLIDVVIPYDKEDRELNNRLSNNQNTGIVFKDHLLELIENGDVKKPKIYLFTARTNLSQKDAVGVDGIIHKPKRPSQIYQKVML